jgi:hypothetical protein
VGIIGSSSHMNDLISLGAHEYHLDRAFHLGALVL